MASVQPRGSKYCVMYRYETETGEIKQKRVSGFKTKEEAWAAAKELEAKSSAGIDVNGDQMTCAEVMERWFADHCSGLAANTRAKYSSAIDKLNETFVANLQVRRLDTNRFNHLLTKLQQQGNIKMQSAITYTEPLRLSLSWALSERLIPINPLSNIHLPVASKRDQVILTDEDVNDLVEVASKQDRRTNTFRIPLLLVLYGGLRREECAGLRWESVDFKACRITIKEAVTMTPDGKEHQKDPKTVLSSRTISMPKWIMDELKIEYDVFLARKDSFILQHNPAHRVCVSSTGEPYYCGSYCHAVYRLIDEANKQRAKDKKPRIPKASFHDLRHTHAAMLIRRGVQPKVISERLGHASIRITMDKYGYLMPGLQDAVAEIFNKEAESKSSSETA